MVDIEDVVAHLGVAKMTIYRAMHDEPPLPSYKVRGRRKFKLSEVDTHFMSRWIRNAPDQTAAS